MPLKKMVFTKLDNGSRSEWEEWDREAEIKNESLFSLGQVYVEAKIERKHWRIFYRMGSHGIDLPSLFKDKYMTQDELKEGIDKFVDWAYDNQIRLIEAHERYCDAL